MEGLQLFALWLEEQGPPLEQEAAVYHATSEKENKDVKVIPPSPRALKNSIFLGACVELKSQSHNMRHSGRMVS
ncbi:Hypothetical protein FKW44_019166 [Caligus rogercresseyi]|uniref:Uncharacterized protein n=1 Tax=Caligus rogercresseyi TaxID=217165 RepID=A0A7T8JXZ6_CALRO|nr:Hypothetical protein FKW44_019166 [Caligus rogercresseyi]